MRRREQLAGFLLAVLTAALFAGSLANEMLVYDDDVYITLNRHVNRGVTRDGLRWALASTDRDNWQPLTWIGHMVAAELSGARPWGHHLLSLLLHAAAALLLYRFLLRATGAFPAALFAAALFAVHPLRVESVAWAAELKDPLSAVFFLLALQAHLRYAARRRPADYLALLGLFALGLMAKPMLVTLPLLLLLVDYWPLHRWSRVAAPRLLLEKAPLAALAAVSGLLTIVAQADAEAFRTLDQLPIDARVANAAVSTVSYLWSFAWPLRLSAFHPHPGRGFDPASAVAAGAAVLALTAVALGQARRRPHLAVGWLWYLLMLAPVAGIVQVGHQGMADRYTYLPQIGVGILLAWGGPELFRRLRAPGAVLPVAACSLLFLAVLTPLRVRAWHDTGRLFTDALARRPDNWFAHLKLAEVEKRDGRIAAALEHAGAAVAAAPSIQNPRFLYGVLLGEAGRYAEAEVQLREALRLVPGWPEALDNLGVALYRQGRYEDALVPLREKLRQAPGSARARASVARAALAAGMVAESRGDAARAGEAYREALAADPLLAEARAGLARLGGAAGAPR
jgi:tetratricopeptide (TPR) repeat protein